MSTSPPLWTFNLLGRISNLLSFNPSDFPPVKFQKYCALSLENYNG